MQASLAVMGALFGVAAWWRTGEGLWLLGALVLLANWPYTLLGILPTNSKLMALDPGQAGPESRRLIETWGQASCRAVRPGLRRDGAAPLGIASFGLIT
jgi:anthrone oxygenase-like protein